MAKTLAKTMVRKVLDVSTSMFIIRSHGDLELLVSRRSIETHTFITSWCKFTTNLEDVTVLFRLPLVADEGATGLVLTDEEGKKCSC